MCHQPYFIEVDQNGCTHCGSGRSWIVIGPDGVGGSTSYDDADTAQEVADALNQAFENGVTSTKVCKHGLSKLDGDCRRCK
jgi:hypothetical protein